MSEVKVLYVEAAELRDIIQGEKDNGRRILALSPSVIVKGKVKTYCLVTQ